MSKKTSSQQLEEGLGLWHAWLENGALRAQEPIYLPMKVAARVTSDFGERDIAQGKVGRSTNHQGIDLVPADGAATADIVAANHSMVLFRGWYNAMLGEAVITGSADGRTIVVYGHLEKGSADHLDIGDTLNREDPIGMLGASGNATGRCLHFLVRQTDRQVDVERIIDDAGHETVQLTSWRPGEYKIAGDGVRALFARYTNFAVVEPKVNGSPVKTEAVLLPHSRFQFGDTMQEVVTYAHDAIGDLLEGLRSKGVFGSDPVEPVTAPDVPKASKSPARTVGSP